MIKKIIKYFIKKNKEKNLEKSRLTRLIEREEYFKNGCIPWSKGYHQHKEEFIIKSINNNLFVSEFFESYASLTIPIIRITQIMRIIRTIRISFDEFYS